MARLKEHLRRWFLAIPPKFWAMCIALCCLGTVLGTTAFYTRFYTVTATEGTHATVLAPKGALSLALQLADVQPEPEDELVYADSGDGLASLHVERSFPVMLCVDGTSTPQRVVKGTVADALQALGVTLGEEDYTEPAVTEPVTRETGTITVHRVTYRDYSVDEIIPYETEYQYTSLFYRTQKRVLPIQEGQNGYLKADLRDKLIDGEVVETVALQVERDVQPVPEILKVYKDGAPISAVEPPEGVALDANGAPTSYSTVYEMKATGYYSPRGRGSSGLGLYYGTFAVDPTLIPYGTKVYIASADRRFVYGWAIATDTGLFTQTNRMQVDLFYETYTESAANGVQYVQVFIP